MNIKVGDFVTCLYTTHVCIVLNIKEDGLTKIESILDQHTYGCSVRNLTLVQEQDIDPEIGIKVIYDNQLWSICANMRTDYKDGNWKVYDLKNESGCLTGLEREQFTIYNPVVDWAITEKEVKVNSVITTGSFVYHKTKDKYGVVMQIDNDNILAIRDLVNEDIGFLYEEESDHLEIVGEESIELRPGMKIIYDGKVGTYFNSAKADNGEVIHYITETGLSIGDDEYEIFNPYFHYYEEKNGVKLLKLRDFIRDSGSVKYGYENEDDKKAYYFKQNLVNAEKTLDKFFHENFGDEDFDCVNYPGGNIEKLGCSTSFPAGELKKGIEYRDFVKMAENDIETRTIETNFGKVTFVGEDLFKMDSDYKGPALTSFDFAEFDHGEGSEDNVTYEQEVFEYKAGYSEEIDERNLLLNSLTKLQSYLDQLDPNANFSNEDFCKGISKTLFHSIAINFINKVIVRKYGQKVVLKLIFNGYSTQISFTISTREDSENYVVKLLVFDNFKCKESFTGCLASAYKYFDNLINSQDLNKSLFDKPDEDPFDEEPPFKPIEQNIGLKQSEGKLMVQELYWPFIEQMARVMTINKEKYPPKNYMKPMDKEELLAAAQRHQLSIWLGEEIDPTDGQPHAVKVATNMMMYYCQFKLY